jgi:tRNA pseudouridine55 synthase
MDIDGLLLIDKPKGCTSHDVVDFVRKRFRFDKVGHCGTLDPMATGLLMLLIGKATKMSDLLMSEDKEYRGTMKLGQVTDSQDADGKITEEHPVPVLSKEQIDVAFRKYLGEFYQIPPMVSAIKKGGVPLYKLARAGKVVEREPRLTHVLKYAVEAIELPEISFRISCSKGFYVRTYCHDIGADLGCGAHLIQLSRTKSGNFSLDKAVSWPELQKMEDPREVASRILTLPEVSRLRRQ